MTTRRPRSSRPCSVRDASRTSRTCGVSGPTRLSIVAIASSRRSSTNCRSSENHGNGFVRTVLGGFNFSGTYTAESGQKATVLSGIDSNLNGDAAADRAIRNPNGVRGYGQHRHGALHQQRPGPDDRRLPGRQPERGVHPRRGRAPSPTRPATHCSLPGINNLDFSIFKNFRFGRVAPDSSSVPISSMRSTTRSTFRVRPTTFSRSTRLASTR